MWPLSNPPLSHPGIMTGSCGLVGCVQGRGLGARSLSRVFLLSSLFIVGLGYCILSECCLYISWWWMAFCTGGGGLFICWGASVALCLWFRFCAWFVIAVGGPFFGPGGCCYWVLWELCVLFGRELGASVPPLPRFILLQSFSDTLLVVSILDVVYDCHW